jgi:hypothetical protein
VEEQFELRGESTPLLESRVLREERMLAGGSGGALLAQPRRLVLGQILMSAASQIWAGTARRACLLKVWFDSMHMCDILASRGLNFADQATSHAMAVLRILWKAEDATRLLSSDSLSTLAEVLMRQGLAVQPVLPDEIDNAEGRILRCLGWQISSPSFHSWLVAFFSRLMVVAKRSLTEKEESDFGAALTQLWDSIYRCGTAVVMHNASLGQLAPRSLALGLLGLGCVRAGVLPLHGARPEWLGAAEWEQVYARAMGSVPVFQADWDAKELMEIIQLATDSNMDVVKDACWRVALVLAGVPMAGAELVAD